MIKLTIVILASLILSCFGVVKTMSSMQGGESFVQEKHPTEQQKAHSKRYKKYATGKKLRELLAAQPRGIKIKIGAPNGGGDPDAPRFSFQEFLRDMTCSADVVVVGSVKNKSSQLTEDEDFIFTDFEIVVEQVLKSHSAAPLQPDANITVTRPGGKMSLDGQLVEAIDLSFKPFEINQRYLLFLKFIPATGGYEAVNSLGSFQLRGNKVIKQTEELLRGEYDHKEATSFLSEVRLASSSHCAPAVGG